MVVIEQEVQSQILRELLTRMQRTFDNDISLWSAAVSTSYTSHEPLLVWSSGCVGLRVLLIVPQLLLFVVVCLSVVVLLLVLLVLVLLRLAYHIALPSTAGAVYVQVTCMSEIDCLLSLVHAQEAMGEPMCVPVFLSSTDPILTVEELRHPCLLGSGYVVVSGYFL